MKLERIVDRKVLTKALTRGRVEDHDTLLLALSFPFLEERSARSNLRLKLRISLHFKAKLLDARTVTLDSRRHQLMTTIREGFLRNDLVVVVEAEELAGIDSIPDFDLHVRTANEADLIDVIEEKMIWIFGSPRSGSTWLSHDILAGLPSRARPSDDTGMRPIDEMGLGQLLGSFVFEPEHFFGIDKISSHADSGSDFDTVHGKRKPLNSPIFERHLFKGYHRPESMLSDVTRGAISDMIRKVTFRHVLLHWGLFDYDCVVFKAPNEGHAADLIMDALPRARMIFLVRDGRDVIRSRFSPFASQVLAETSDRALRRTAVAYYAHQWNWHTDIVQRAYDHHDVERRLLISYEDLRNGSLRAFLRLLNFVGANLDLRAINDLMERTRLESFPEEARGPHLPRQEGRIGGYRTSFTNEEIQLMNSIMANNLYRYGYDNRESDFGVAQDRP